MPLEIAGARYLTAGEVAEEVGVSRQTLWRWQQEQKIPPGKRYRGRMLVFTADEVDEIREYADRLEPAGPSPGRQIPLFPPAEVKA
jgi:predicted DNA-binding transcriptional regulator AlpA